MASDQQVDLPGFGKPGRSDAPTSRGELPEGWELHSLDEIVGDVQSGFACGIKEVENGIPHLRMNNVTTTGRLDLSLIRRVPTDYKNFERYLLRPGDVIFNNTNSAELVGKTVLFDIRDGEWVYSNHLTRLRPLSEMLSSEWLWLALRMLWQQGYFKNICKRWVGQSAVSQEKLKLTEILVPPLPDQRRIVARIEEFARRVEEALDRLSKLETEFDSLCRAILFDTSDGEPVPTPMHELVRFRQPDVTVSKTVVYHFAGVYSFGRGVFTGPVKSGSEFAYTRLTRLRAGEFIYPKLMAWEGGLGVVPPECDGFVVSPEYPVFEINPDRALPETLDIYFRTPEIWPVLSEISTGTNARRKRLHPSAFLAYEMPLPPMRTQLRLREIKRRVDEMRKRHAKQKAELAALMPSVLAKAFAGELFA